MSLAKESIEAMSPAPIATWWAGFFQRFVAFIVLGPVFVASVGLHLLVYARLPLDENAVPVAAAILLVIFAVVIANLPYHHRGWLGYANLVTAIRAAIVCTVGSSIVFSGGQRDASSFLWIVIALVAVALLLDGLDGYLARRYRQESTLGARFDMEIDALQILVLSVAAFLFAKAGAWVLLIGAMRYGFVLAQYLKPRLNAPLPVSARRKLVCVIQVLVLCVVLLPPLGPPVSSVLAAFALVLLTYSFVVDILWILET